MKLVEVKGRIGVYPRGIERVDADMERGLLAIKLFQIATTTNPALLLPEVADEQHMEFRKAWRLTKQVLSAAEISAFKEMLKHYSN
ncbi:hypothetical protein QUA54_31550 [Microcoleus sp. MOSTC5]|uniref:hypothetical protein n=1 Tax=Microcoleus sp. MOSTC5 TaxID=3055378 RepID=UPI002FD0FE17